MYTCIHIGNICNIMWCKVWHNALQVKASVEGATEEQLNNCDVYSYVEHLIFEYPHIKNKTIENTLIISSITNMLIKLLEEENEISNLSN